MRRISTRRWSERLDYRGPQLLLEAVRRMQATPLRFGSVLDLGCGTGLAGVAFRPYCDQLVGVDISSGMVEQARAKGLYDRLAVGELVEFLAAEHGAQHHLALAADVFVYCSDLAPIAAAVARVLAPGGLFAFTVETHDGHGVQLQGTLRYAHGDGSCARGASKRPAFRFCSLRKFRPAPRRARRCRAAGGRPALANVRADCFRNRFEAVALQ